MFMLEKFLACLIFVFNFIKKIEKNFGLIKIQDFLNEKICKTKEEKNLYRLPLIHPIFKTTEKKIILDGFIHHNNSFFLSTTF